MSEVTRILDAIEEGDPHAGEQLLPLVYEEMRQLAAQKLGPQASSIRERSVKIRAKVVRHAKYVVFQLAEAAVSRELFAAILERIGRLRVACASG